MPREPKVISGTVKGGVIIPDFPAELPEGSRVGILIDCAEFPLALQQEMAAWDKASEEAWELINEWERDDRT